MLSVVMPPRLKFVTVLDKKETGRYLKTIIEGHIGRKTDHGFEIRTIYLRFAQYIKIAAFFNYNKRETGCNIDTTGSRQRVKVVERHIRTIKERICTGD